MSEAQARMARWERQAELRRTAGRLWTGANHAIQEGERTGNVELEATGLALLARTQRAWQAANAAFEQVG